MERCLIIENLLRKFTKQELVDYVSKLRMFSHESRSFRPKIAKDATKIDENACKRLRSSCESAKNSDKTTESAEASKKVLSSDSSSEEESIESDEETEESDESKADMIEKLMNRLQDDVSTEYITSHLDLFYVFLRRTRRTWRLFQLMSLRDSDGTQLSLDPRSIEKRLRKNLYFTFDSTIIVEIHLGAYWIRIPLVQRRRRANMNPVQRIVYAVYYSHISYIGVTEIIKKHSAIVLNALAKTFGYGEVKQTALVDRNVEGLFQLALDKGNVGFRLQHNLENPLSFSKQEKCEAGCSRMDPRIRDLDAKRKEEREAYNKLHFGSEEKPPIQQLTYKLQAPFEDETVKLKSDAPFECKVVFEGKDVIKGIQELVRLGIAKIPLPKYVADVRTLGKTEFVITKKSPREENDDKGEKS